MMSRFAIRRATLMFFSLVFAGSFLWGCGADGSAVVAGTDPESQYAVLEESASTEAAESDSQTAEATKLVEGEDWPQFLGLQGTGVSGESDLLADWPKAGPPILWEKTIGTGYSAPSILGNRLIMHHRLGSKEIVECLRADDGERLWKYDYRSTYSDPYGYNNGPRCSPVLTKDRCYTYGAEGKLLCLELTTGKKIWEREVQADFKLPMWFFGIGCSPILEGDFLIALVGGQPDSGVVAFNKNTGETVWEAVGKKTWNNAATWWKDQPTYDWTGEEQVISYSSPYVFPIHKKRHLLMVGRQGLVSLDPATGKENFKSWFASRSFESVNAARPLVVENQIYLSSAYKVGSELLEVAPDGKSVRSVWRDSENMLNHWSTSIITGGAIYGFSGRHEKEGELRCIDFKTGEVLWKTTGFEGDIGAIQQDPNTGEFLDPKTKQPMPYPFYGRGSKIQIGDRFIVLGERGTLALVKVNSERWEELARTSYAQITAPSWTAPVLSRKRLYLRDEDSLLCLDLSPSKK